MENIVSFIHHLKYDDLPEDVVQQSKVCLLDLLGVAVAGHATRLSKIISDFVGSQYPGEVPLLFSPRRASACGAAMFGAMLIDSLDAHDGMVLAKGHSGVAILPALLAVAEANELDGKDFLTALVLGYEIAMRAGIALHAMASDYHTSGAWNGIGVAAGNSAYQQVNTGSNLGGVGQRRVLRSSQSDDALYRPPHDDQGRLRLGRFGWNQQRVTGSGRFYRCTGGNLVRPGRSRHLV